MIKDITNLFKNTDSNLIKNQIEKGGIVLGLKMEGQAGLLVKNVKLSDAIQSAISKKSGVGGFISTDELPHYGITAEEKIAVEKSFSCSKKDAVVFVAADKIKSAKAVELISGMIETIKTKKPVKTPVKRIKKTVKKQTAKKKKSKKKK